MKTSEFIQKLQELIDIYGDLEIVYLPHNDNYLGKEPQTKEILQKEGIRVQEGR